PHLVRFAGEQLRPAVGGVGELVATLADLALRGEQPVHRALRGEIGPLVEQRGVHVRGRAVNEPLLVQPRQHRAVRSGSDSARGDTAGGRAARTLGGERQRYSDARLAPSTRHAGKVPTSGSARLTACSIIAWAAARRDRSRSWAPADPPRALRRFPAPRSPDAPSQAQPPPAPAGRAPRAARAARSSARAARVCAAPGPAAHPRPAACATPPNATSTGPHGATS